MLKDVRISDFLTAREIKLARAIYDKVEPAKRNSCLVAKIIAPNIERINTRLGQDNDASFLAYAIEHTFIVRKKYGGKYTRQHKNTPRGFGGRVSRMRRS
jgi:hypothetical protein